MLSVGCVGLFDQINRCPIIYITNYPKHKEKTNIPITDNYGTWIWMDIVLPCTSSGCILFYIVVGCVPALHCNVDEIRRVALWSRLWSAAILMSKTIHETSSAAKKGIRLMAPILIHVVQLLRRLVDLFFPMHAHTRKSASVFWIFLAGLLFFTFTTYASCSQPIRRNHFCCFRIPWFPSFALLRTNFMYM